MTVSGSRNTVTIQNLQEGTQYVFQVAAVVEVASRVVVGERVTAVTVTTSGKPIPTKAFRLRCQTTPLDCIYSGRLSSDIIES